MSKDLKRAREEAERILEKASVPAIYDLRTRRVREEFWPKLRRALGRLPFATDLAAAYYAARDPLTPTAAKASLMAALFYFVTPADLIPDVVTGLGLTDDAMVLAILMTLSAAHIQDKHRQLAHEALIKT
ncbi:MAG: YkvA family protein [Caulobacterales bacterium]